MTLFAADPFWFDLVLLCAAVLGYGTWKRDRWAREEEEERERIRRDYSRSLS